MDDQDKLRERLLAVLRLSPVNMTDIARAIGTSHDLVRHFINGKRKTHFKSLRMIEGWIVNEEKRLGIG